MSDKILVTYATCTGSILQQKVVFRLSVMLGVWTEGDHRDWDAIRAWAENLLPRFG